MIVAIRSAKWGEVDSLETLLGFDEFEYLALFLWLAIAGPARCQCRCGGLSSRTKTVAGVCLPARCSPMEGRTGSIRAASLVGSTACVGLGPRHLSPSLLAFRPDTASSVSITLK